MWMFFVVHYRVLLYVLWSSASRRLCQFDICCLVIRLMTVLFSDCIVLVMLCVFFSFFAWC